MRFFLCVLLISFTSILYAQQDDVKEIYYYKIEITKAIGDLNNDGLNDLVVVTQDTIAEKQPYKLQIFFAKPDGSDSLYIETTTAVLPNYPEGKKGYDTGRRFSQVYINEGNLYISHDQTRGHFEHKFHFQNGDFVLVGFNEIESDGIGTLTQSYFNLTTAELIVRQEKFATGEVINLEKEFKLIVPLPKLQDFQPLSNEFF